MKLSQTITLLTLLIHVAASHCATGEETLRNRVQRVSASELRIDRDYIGEPDLARPVPQGLVDVNPPWLHVHVPLRERNKSERATEQWNRRFYFKLSQDAQLNTNVLASHESGPQLGQVPNLLRR